MTELQQHNHEQTLALWSDRITECRNSGQPVSYWCKDHGIYTSTYYKWQKKIYDLTTQTKPQFVEVGTNYSGKAIATIHIGDAEVELEPGIDEETLLTICKVLKSC